MSLLQDIVTEDDIKLLVDSFYNKVMKDEVICYFFIDVTKLDLTSHLPIMYSFWSSMLLGTNTYKNNPMAAHIALHKKSKLEKKHFDRWQLLFNETVDQLFLGSRADEAKQRVDNMVGLMLFKVKASEEEGFIQ